MKINSVWRKRISSISAEPEPIDTIDASIAVAILETGGKFIATNYATNITSHGKTAAKAAANLEQALKSYTAKVID